MLYCIRNSSSIFLKVYCTKLAEVRFLRNTAHRSPGPRLLEGKVKTVTKISDENLFPRIESYEDLLKSFRNSDSAVSELDLEEALTTGDDFGSVFEKCDRVYAVHKREEKQHKFWVKNQIVKRKYCKFDKETDLLTHAAKEQIRYLHRLDPLKWTPEILAESFPISVNGVKKLLKNKFVEKRPEKIKLHDEEVAKRWKILQSGRDSSFISPVTQRLWREGKLIQNYYSGNPNLPEVPHDHAHEILKEEKEECIGEFSSIIKSYVEYKKKTALEKNPKSPLKSSSENELIKLENNSRDRQKGSSSIFSPGYFASEEADEHSSVYTKRKKAKEIGETDLLHPQLKEHFAGEVDRKKSKSAAETEYQKWIQKQLETEKIATSKQPYNAKEFFTPISKYQKDYIELKRDSSESDEFIYDDRIGYQHPKGKNIKPKISIPSKLHKQGKLYKRGQCIYDADGEFLYKLPK
ncbi:uncharacterized protein LOC118190794 [Stegodyphus dumicola]|uniref:uncharacterized protein LOC118190794 n=1 Tax=Stegodyphus dumicola TaxID=202533 RepID=UPI0015B2FBDF|nr:uncharacterized protein LOC118190794 [Stegodyphus dumicola]